MAEFVEQMMEERLGEIEELKRTNILDEEQVRNLVIKRKQNEYKVKSRNPCKQDFIDTIIYESKLLEFIKIRRKELRMFEKMEEIDFAIIKRQEDLLRKVTHKWWDDIDLWKMRIQFSKVTGRKETVSACYDQMRRHHSHLLSVWVEWAQYEMSHRKDFKKAREILVSQATVSPQKKPLLTRELFKFELLHVQYLFDGKYRSDIENEGSVENLSDAMKKVMNCEAATTVYRDAMDTLNSVKTAIELYHIANQFPFALDIREQILRDILERFPDANEVKLLKAERKAFDLPEDAIESSEDSPDSYQKKYDLYVESCKAKKVAKAAFTRNQRSEMVRNYVSFSLSHLSTFNANNDREAISSFVPFILNELLSLLYHLWPCKSTRMFLVSSYSKTCHQFSHLLSPQQFVIWVSLLENSTSGGQTTKTVKALRKAVSLHKSHDALSVFGFERFVKNAKNNENILKEYSTVSKQLSGIWQSVAHGMVLDALKVGPERNAFIKKHSKPSVNNVIAKNTKIRNFWAAYEENGLEGARAAYKLLDVTDNMQSSMMAMEFALFGEKKPEKKAHFVIDVKGQSDGEEESDEGVDFDEREENDEGEESDGDESDEGDESDDGDECDEGDESDGEEENDDSDIEQSDGKVTNTVTKSDELMRCKSVNPNHDVEKVRKLFEEAVEYCPETSSHHDVWLCYGEFEHRFGSAKNYELLMRRGEYKMSDWSYLAYKQLVQDIKDKRFVAENVDDNESFTEVQPPTYPLPAFMKALSSMYRKKDIMPSSRDKFFCAIESNLKRINKKPDIPVATRVPWYNVLTMMLDGNRIKRVGNPQKDLVPKKSVVPKVDPMTLISNENFTKDFKRKNKPLRLSDSLKITEEEDKVELPLIMRDKKNKGVGRDNIDEMLQRSEVMQPGILKEFKLETQMSKRAKQKKAREERAKTAGKQWDYMKKPEMTEENKTDLELLKMRDVLDPKQRYKNSSMKHTPKYFQMGTIKDDPRYFYSDRLTKKERKATIAEQIMNNSEVQKHQKRKYDQLVAKKESIKLNKRRKKFGADFVEL